jgi:serine/threonine-protein kinase
MAEDPRLVERFHREARNAAAITHPCVTYVFDVGWNDDKTIPYMAMELLDGKNLASVIRASGALSVQRAVQIGSRVLDALEAAHRLGVVHRDLKPENIFLAQQGTQENVKVLDFGISKVVGHENTDSLTKTGTMLGTPAYMSPEQVKCARDVDARADLYALGVVLYEMLAGRPAFEAETFTEIVYKILSEEPPPLLTRRPGLDPTVVDLVQRAMHKDPSRRWPTAEAMRAALQEVVVDTSPGEPKPTPLAWELPSSEDVSSAATKAARQAWDLQQAAGVPARPKPTGAEATVVAKSTGSVKVRAGTPSSEHRVRISSSAPHPLADSELRISGPVAAAPPVEPPPPRRSGVVPALHAGPAVASVPPPAPVASTLTGTATALGVVEAQSRSNRALWIGVPIVALVGVLAAGLALWLRGGGELPFGSTTTPSTAASPLLPPLASRTAELSMPSTAQGCRVHINVSTPGATLALAGESFSGSVDLPAVCGAHHSVRVEAPGYVTQNFDVMASAGPARVVELAPIAAPPAPAPDRPAAPRPPSAHRRAPVRDHGDDGLAAPAADDDPPVNLEANPF